MGTDGSMLRAPRGARELDDGDEDAATGAGAGSPIAGNESNAEAISSKLWLGAAGAAIAAAAY